MIRCICWVAKKEKNNEAWKVKWVLICLWFSWVPCLSLFMVSGIPLFLLFDAIVEWVLIIWCNKELKTGLNNNINNCCTLLLIYIVSYKLRPILKCQFWFHLRTQHQFWAYSWLSFHNKGFILFLSCVNNNIMWSKSIKMSFRKQYLDVLMLFKVVMIR